MKSPSDFNSDEEFILWLFSGRCIVCFKPYQEIHEIIPRAFGYPSMEIKNRVPLCSEHHREYHHKGISAEVIKELKERRVEVLEMIGRSEYVE